MKFIADDGTIFDTMEECQEYEHYTDKKTVENLLKQYVTMYDANGREIIIKDSFSGRYLDKFDELLLKDAMYIKINNHPDIDNQIEVIVNFLNEQYGTEFPNSVGIFRYDESDYEWKRFSDESDRLIRN